MAKANWLERARAMIPFGPKPTIPRGDLLALKPIQNPAVRARPRNEDDPTEGTALTVPRRDDRMARLVARLFRIPAQRIIELDEFGSEIWALCDGQHSVDQLITHTCRKYKLNRRQGEVSVAEFMKMLAQRRLIGFKTQQKDTHDGNHTQRRRFRGGPRRRH